MATLGMPLLGMGQETPTLTSLLTARREREKQSKLADLLANAYGAKDDAQRQQYMQEAIRTDPTQSMTLAKLLDPRLSGSGGKPAQQQYAEWLLSQVPEDKRGHTLGYLAGYENRPSGAAIKYDEIVGEDGIKRPVAFDPRQPGVQVVGIPPGVDQRQPEALGGQLFAGLGQIPGIQVTSGLRTPERNAQVGGVPNSYHLTGQARDIVPPRSQEQAQQVRQYATQNGLEIIDEGDHWHLEPAPRRGAQRGAPNPFQSRPQEQQKYLDEQAQQRAQIDMLPQRGALEAQIAAMKAKAEADAKAAAERDSQVATKAVDAQRTLGLLGEAERLLPLSTGSSAGNVVDSVAGAFGYSTPGAQAIAGLQAIAGQLTSSMPRMQGPQSDKDVQLYKQMAGDLANPNIPVPTRMAALQQIRRLNQKYAGQQAQQPQRPAASGGWKIEVVN